MHHDMTNWRIFFDNARGELLTCPFSVIGEHRAKRAILPHKSLLYRLMRRGTKTESVGRNATCFVIPTTARRRNLCLLMAEIPRHYVSRNDNCSLVRLAPVPILRPTGFCLHLTCANVALSTTLPVRYWRVVLQSDSPALDRSPSHAKSP